MTQEGVLACLLSAGIFAMLYGLTLWSYGQKITPDGRIYEAAAGRIERAPLPYSLRWLLPTALGPKMRYWQWSSGAALVLTGPVLCWYLLICGLSANRALAGSLLFCGLPGVFRLAACYPLLVDAPAMLCAIGVAALDLSGHRLAAVVLAVAGGCVRETVPIWAALYAASAWPLIGLISPAVGLVAIKHAAPPAWARSWLESPIQSARKYHAGMMLDARTVILPWGVVLPLFALGAGSGQPWIAATLALIIGYSQLLVANDLTRLYQLAAPVVIATAIAWPSQEWLPVICVFQLANPWQAAEV